MNNILVAKSKPILLDLENYSEGKSTLKGYLIKDTYSSPKTKVDHGQYRIYVESPIIRDDSDFSRHLNAIKGIVRRLTILSKCIIGEAFNTSPWDMDLFTKRIELIGQMPLGWESNYDLVRKELDKKKRLTVHIEVEPNHYCRLSASPFNDYITAFKAFPYLKTIERYLLQLMNDADLVSSTGRYMLLSKALEMVNAMYPLTKRKDERLQTILPELGGYFNGVTLKTLMDIANNRRETRHYVDKSSESLSHQAMSEEERKLFYLMTNQICLNIIRRSLGLGLVNFCTDNLSQH